MERSTEWLQSRPPGFSQHHVGGRQVGSGGWHPGSQARRWSPSALFGPARTADAGVGACSAVDIEMAGFPEAPAKFLVVPGTLPAAS